MGKELIDWSVLEEIPYAPLAEMSRRIAAEGCVLLENEGNILPISTDTVISVFGRTQFDYYKSGSGSGGLVRTEYAINIIDGMLANDKIKINMELVDVYRKWLEENPFVVGTWGKEPWCQFEMVPSAEIVKAAKKKSDVAVIVIGRTAGEDRDNSADKGSWYLTDEEEAMLAAVSAEFEKTVAVLNVGNIIDMSWVKKYNIKSVVYAWQGGQEGGNAVADVLCGDVTPSGRLTDTIAKDINAYPSTRNFGDADRNFYEEDIYVGYRYFETFAKDDVLYPFGFGLSYTTFVKEDVSVKEEDGRIIIDVTVRNVGNYCGKEVVMAYFGAPCGLLGKSVRELCAFEKTKTLEPGESQKLTLVFSINSMSAYDDSGITGNKSCYVMEAGEYNIYLGGCVRCAEKIYVYKLDELKIVSELEEAVAPVEDFDIIYPIVDGDEYKIGKRKASKRTVNYRERIKREIPSEITPTGDKGIKLIDVKEGRNTMEEFVAQLSDFNMMCIERGEGMSSPKVRPGCGGAFGGVSEELLGFGVPMIAVTDGPSGIRLDSGETATSIPNGTLIACTWDVQAAQELYELVAIELCTHRVDSLLGPGINIHRSPLNGRNFEYFSEDPFITGKMAAAQVRGMKKYGCEATIKHFAANSQEYRRLRVNSVMSERAAREIYLKGFELAVKEADTMLIMSSYNPVNGIWSANNYELHTTILRNEWGYKGVVMTDWWPTTSLETEGPRNLKNMVEAQNDLFMVTAEAVSFEDNLEEALANGEITRGQLQRNTINILNYIIQTHSFDRFIKFGGKLERSLAEDMDELYDAAVIENPQCREDVEFEVRKPGMHLLVIEYESHEPAITQIIVSVKINGLNAADVVVSGTNGETALVYRDISVANIKGKANAVFNDSQIKIKRIVFKAKK